MLKRMEQNGLIVRERSTEDERSVMIKLTEKGHWFTGRGLFHSRSHFGYVG